MSFKNRIAILESQQEEIKKARKAIRKEGKIKKKNRNILYNLDNLLRRELDTSPYQTIVTPGGLWIDYEPDFKKGKVERFFNEKIEEPFSKKYLRPNKEVMQQHMDDNFNVIYNGLHVAKIEYTRFKEAKVTKEEKDRGLGFGNGIGKNWGGSLFDLPPKAMMQVRYYGYIPGKDDATKLYRSSNPYKPGDKRLQEIAEKVADSKYNWILADYDTYGNRKELKGQGLVFYIVTYQEFIKQNDTSALDEDIWQSFAGDNVNIPGVFLEWDEIYAMRTRIYTASSKLFRQFMVYDYAWRWMQAIELYGFDRITVMDNVVPVRELKLFDEKNPDDVAYDGPIEDLL